jgi:hypothetical protein
MQGSEAQSGELFSYVDLEKRVPEKQPPRLVRVVVNDVLAALDSDFATMRIAVGRLIRRVAAAPVADAIARDRARKPSSPSWGIR